MVLYSSNPEADRRFFRDVLGFEYVDAGEGWLIFALPPTEVAVHPAKPSGGSDAHTLFLVCRDLGATVASLRRRRVKCELLEEQSWGKVAMIELPSGAELGLYEPKHPLAAGSRKRRRRAR